MQYRIEILVPHNHITTSTSIPPSETSSTLEQTESDDIVPLTMEEKERIYDPWKHSVIVKAIGKRFNHHYLCKKLADLWKISDPFPLIVLGKEFYTAKFNREDLQWKVLQQGPWFVAGAYLSVRTWVANFVPSDSKVLTTAIWCMDNTLDMGADPDGQAGEKLGKFSNPKDITAGKGKAVNTANLRQGNSTKHINLMGQNHAFTSGLGYANGPITERLNKEPRPPRQTSMGFLNLDFTKKAKPDAPKPSFSNDKAQNSSTLGMEAQCFVPVLSKTLKATESQSLNYYQTPPEPIPMVSPT
ncbi:hypothetical protein BC332_09602 [Capsicum chinense]|nr:hypothetical protein BC332_09602 [Capsicum chinense]